MWSKRRTRALQSASQIIATALSEEAALELAIAGLWKRWEEIAGPELGKLLVPLGHQGRELRVGAQHPAILQEASFLGPALLDRANALLEQPYFQEVRFELPGSRTALNQNFLSPPPPKTPTPCPTPIGGLQLPEDSPVGRAYRTYVARLRAAASYKKES
jgi:hypothetical protein